MTAATTSRARARPLPPEQRRAAIVEAAVPLVRRSGRAVTTAEIARAASVSEATVFHVFGTKDALIDAVVEHEFSLDSTERLLAEMATEADLPERLVPVVRILRERLQSVFQLMAVLQMKGPPAVARDPRHPHHARLLAVVADILRPDAERLRYSPERAAELVRLITFATSHPLITHGKPLTADEATDLILHGIARDRDGGEPC